MSEPVKKELNAHQWERDADNFYVEPEWVTTRLFEAEKFEGKCVDPCAGGGNVIRGAKAAGYQVIGYDLRDRGFPGIKGGIRYDFFKNHWHPGVWPTVNIIANPPYGKVAPEEREKGGLNRLEERFVELALARVHSKVAVFLDAKWANGATRGAWLETLPLYRVYKVGPRPPCPPGHVYYGSQENLANGKTDFSWYVFLKGFAGFPTTHWLRRDGREAKMQNNPRGTVQHKKPR